ncbi:MAG: geranylgeranyl reductase family protein [Gammaproteobacteria bacterium]|jgi:geranylgeranyl reductase family protein|nr:geranylgeranyl reductase family protein [Gammaproteobacteria bacterium]
MQYDVIIVGAGPAGSTTARHLAEAGVSTLLLDKSDFPRDKVCGDCLSPRAQHYLARLGVLEAVAAEAHAARRIRFRAPGGAEASAAITADGHLPDRTLVLPRRRFDHLLQRHALAAGADFRVGHVRALLPTGGVLLGDTALPARLVIIATGAALSLIKHTPLAPGDTVHTVAARAYLRGMQPHGPDLRILLDRLPLPGYAWLFPTGPHSANVGCWYAGPEPISAPALLRELLTEHPTLAALTAAAGGSNRIAGYPIRCDFLTAPKVASGVLAVGEAAGLVNPFTGEGIDYALESAELAAAAARSALSQGAADGPVPAEVLADYPRALNRRFRKLFRVMTAVQRYGTSPWVLDRMFGRGRQGQPLLDRLVQVCFGAAAPTRLLAPAALGRLLLSRPRRPGAD